MKIWILTADYKYKLINLHSVCCCCITKTKTLYIHSVYLSDTDLPLGLKFPLHTAHRSVVDDIIQPIQRFHVMCSKRPKAKNWRVQIKHKMKRLYWSFQLAASFLQFPAKPSPQQPHGVKPYDCCKRLRARRIANVKEAIPSPQERHKRQARTHKQAVAFEDKGELIFCDVKTSRFLFAHFYCSDAQMLLLMMIDNTWLRAQQRGPVWRKMW